MRTRLDVTLSDEVAAEFDRLCRTEMRRPKDMVSFMIMRWSSMTAASQVGAAITKVAPVPQKTPDELAKEAERDRKNALMAEFRELVPYRNNAFDHDTMFEVLRDQPRFRELFPMLTEEEIYQVAGRPRPKQDEEGNDIVDLDLL